MNQNLARENIIKAILLKMFGIFGFLKEIIKKEYSYFMLIIEST